MKIVYWILGLILVGGVGYLGYRMVTQSPPSNIDNTTNDDNTDRQPSNDNTDRQPDIVALKPVIYLYPESAINVSVNVKPTTGLSYTEPTIGVNGWNVTATPDGTIWSLDGKTWPYLFWEGNPWSIPIPKEGFVVAQTNLDGFFDEKLSLLGLATKEISDFKEYWLPIMQDKPYYFITFISQSVFDAYAPLTVNPAPDTVIRVFFHHQGLDRLVPVTEQVLTPAPERIGFTLVEWGGNGYL
ncbi:hypothetical protein JXA59_01080 [Patescibacteria group bacterium]|nr:hypothetical protein [Patescibacteria group bacterium]